MKIIIFTSLFFSCFLYGQISEKGKKRLEENLKTFSLNMKETERNLSACQKNIKTLDAELKNLEGLEREHIELRNQYENYLLNAKLEMEKNDKALLELKKYEEKTVASNKNNQLITAQSQAIQKAKKDIEERIRWRSDTLKKIQKFNELEAKLNRNLSSIESRKLPIRNQKANWIEKQKKYENLVSEIQKKQVEARQLLKQSTN